VAGIYIHIPFCKQACHYCDFHFSTNQSVKTALCHAIAAELAMQASYLKDQSIETIYWGGGTPTLLTGNEIEIIQQALTRHFDLRNLQEITIEANPDDLSKEKLVLLKQLGFNRLSIGIQSFDDALLKHFNRAHNSIEALACIENSRETGFENISIDLIYSIPMQDMDLWKRNIEKAILLNPEHISAYSLTLEEKTVFGKWHKKGLLKEVDEVDSALDFELLMDMLGNNGYEQYEISNFSKSGFQAKHNSNYWKQAHYLGVGPSAHSYNGESRQANRSNNQLYIKAIESEVLPSEVEWLTRENKINEYIFTSLRTAWGCSLRFLLTTHNFDLRKSSSMQRFVDQQLIVEKGETIFLTRKGQMLADAISSELFISA
jgi:oxygen-independent coproporphyrinogen III oxidase